jgi:demethylsterigmatocystin 6-O-methyltransferase
MTWLAKNPKHMSYLQQSMVLLRSNDWLATFPMEQEVSAWDEPEKPFFVDVGGGFGHQCVGLREKYPTLRGSVVLQDLPQTLQQVKPIEGVQILAHDFFQPQPIHGMSIQLLSPLSG